MSEINKVVTKFSFLGSLKPQETFNKNLGASVKLLAGASTAIVSSATAFVAWTTVVSQSLDPMVQLSRETDVAIETIQELGYAASQNGSDLNAVTSSLSELNKRAGEFARTGGGSAAEAFLMLGTEVNDASGKMKTADNIMLDLRGSLQQFSKAEQADLLDKLGIDGSLIQTLNLTGDAMDSLRKKASDLGTVTKEQGDALASLNDSNTTLAFGLKSVQNQIAVGFAPVLKGLTEGLIDFLAANKDAIQNGIKELGKALVTASYHILRISSYVIDAAKWFLSLDSSIHVVAAAITVFMLPIIATTALLVGIALVIDDLIVAFNGGQSAIADFVMEMTGIDMVPILKAVVADVVAFGNKIVEILHGLKDLVMGLFSGIGDIWSGDTEQGLDKIMEAVKAFVMKIKDIFLSAFNYIAEKFDAIIPDFLKDDKAVEVNQTGFIGGNSGAVEHGGRSNSYNSSSNVSQSNNISVYSNDPNAAGQAVADHSQKQMREAYNHYNRGGM